MVLRRVPRRAGNVLPSYEVAYRDGATLLIPEAACTPAPEDELNVKLSVKGLREMVSLLEARDEQVDEPDQAGGGLGNVSAGAAPTRHRRSRRGAGGGSAL